MTDATGTVAWAADYLPFGGVDITVEAVENNLRFPGQYYDGETGLHYNYHRYYDPATGRYLTADPIGLAGGINLFGYVGGNPVNLIDPLGLTAMEWAVPAGIVLSQIDSPVLPFGDVAGGALISIAWLYDNIDDDYDSMMEKKYGGYKEGKPCVPEGSKKDPDLSTPPRKNKSQDFKDFLRWKGISTKGWRYHMEKWRSPTGDIVNRHYWQSRNTGQTFYHLR